MRLSRKLLIDLSVAALLVVPALALAQGTASTESAPVLSSTPIFDNGQLLGYSVRYQVDGRTYVTRTDSPPGATIPIERSDYGVTTPATPAPVAPHAALQAQPLPGDAPWRHAVPEPGVVLSADGTPLPPPGYAPPVAPVVVAPAWPAPYSYYYPPAYVGPPVGITLGLGYARGWHGGYWHRGYWPHGYWHRGWHR